MKNYGKIQIPNLMVFFDNTVVWGARMNGSYAIVAARARQDILRF